MTITKTKTWQKLQDLAEKSEEIHLRDEFNNDPNRFDKFSLKIDQLLFDYSKQRISDKTLGLLFKLAEEADLSRWQNKLFSGEKINHTENRSVLHTALRDISSEDLIIEGQDVKKAVSQVINKMRNFIEKIHTGTWKGFTGRPIDTVINIGIGGSDLGPKMLYNALKPFHEPGIKVHFVSNLDGADLAEYLSEINPETTLFTIASKTFTTLETIQNANTARTWFLRNCNNQKDIAKHFVAISTNTQKVTDFGIPEENMFEFWDWVGGRFSLWSAIGLPLALGIGMNHFNSLREGAFDIDQHFMKAPFEKNIPVIMALLGVWNRNFLKADTLAILPYEHCLSLFPDYLQQLEMESNGKSVDRDGNTIDYATNPVVWGSTGNNGQHAFFQLLHQSKTLIPIDFIGAVNSSHSLKGHQPKLISNMVAQAEALMIGKTADEAKASLKENDLDNLIPYKVFAGNVPSSTLLFNNITPYTLGMLIAIYEHKVFVQGVIWNVNSFDQWGVELGKELANNILKDLSEKPERKQHDSSTENLIKHFQENFLDEII